MHKKQQRTGLVNNLKKVVKDQRVSVFIDAANLFFAIQKKQIRIDYGQVLNWFNKNSKLSECAYFTAFNPEDENQLNFLSELEDTGYRVIKKPIKVFDDQIKGNMDIELAVDALQNADNFDILVLFSGDGDFTYLVKKLAEMNKKVLVLGVGGFMSYELHKEAEEYFFLERIKPVWQTPRRENIQKSEVTISLGDSVYTHVISKYTNSSKVRTLPKKTRDNASSTKSVSDENTIRQAEPKDTKKPNSLANQDKKPKKIEKPAKDNKVSTPTEKPTPTEKTKTPPKPKLGNKTKVKVRTKKKPSKKEDSEIKIFAG